MLHEVAALGPCLGPFAFLVYANTLLSGIAKYNLVPNQVQTQKVNQKCVAGHSAKAEVLVVFPFARYYHSLQSVVRVDCPVPCNGLCGNCAQQQGDPYGSVAFAGQASP
eukprot:6479025-Amphidinium_carterae.1